MRGSCHWRGEIPSFLMVQKIVRLNEYNGIWGFLQNSKKKSTFTSNKSSSSTSSIKKNLLDIIATVQQGGGSVPVREDSSQNKVRLSRSKQVNLTSLPNL